MEKQVDVAVEPGTPNDFVIRFNGEGDEIPGAVAGDLEVRVNVKKHKNFQREGADLVIDKEISLKQALLGFSFTVKFLDGKDLLVSTVPGEVIQYGDIKSVKDKGLPFYKNSMYHGNLVVKFKVKFPEGKAMTSDVKAALDKILPGPSTGPAEKSQKADYFTTFTKADLNTNPKGGSGRDDEDEDGYGQGRHQQRAECGVQ